MKAHAGVLETDDRITASTKLDAAVSDGRDHAWIRTRLRALIGLDAPEATRDENFAAWSAFFVALASRGPLVLVFEDLHWADDALLALLKHLVERARDVPLLLIVTARPEFLHDNPDLVTSFSTAAWYELDPLTVDQAGQLVAVLHKDVVQSPRLVDVLARRSEDNPFYIEESVRLVAEEVEKGLAVIASESRVVDEFEDLCILPGTVQAILAARLDALPASLKVVLADAAVVGPSFWSGALVAMRQSSPGDVDVSLDGHVGSSRGLGQGRRWKRPRSG